MKLIIAGSRTFTDYQLLCQVLAPDRLIQGVGARVSHLQGRATAIVGTGRSSLDLLFPVSQYPDKLSWSDRSELWAVVDGRRIQLEDESAARPIVLFDEGQRKMLSIIASRAAAAIENARLYEDLQATFQQTIEGLAKAIDKMDRYTAGHSDRVAMYATFLARRLGFSPEDVEIVQMDFASVIPIVTFYVPTYSNWLYNEVDYRPVYETLRRFMMLLQWKVPRSPWIHKSLYSMHYIDAFLDAYIAHRLEREAKVLAALGHEPRTVAQLLPEVYDDTPWAMLPIATRSLVAHLEKLAREGRIEVLDTPAGRGYRLRG